MKSAECGPVRTCPACSCMTQVSVVPTDTPLGCGRGTPLIAATPVRVGDTIKAVATVRTANERRGIAKLEFVVENQRGETVLGGEATVLQVEPST